MLTKKLCPSAPSVRRSSGAGRLHSHARLKHAGIQMPARAASGQTFLPHFFIILFFLNSLVFAAEPVFEPVEMPEQRIFPGEVLIYQIKYLGMPVGEGRAEVKTKVLFRGRPAYPIAVTVKSYKTIDWIYKVRDEHHSYIDAEKLSSLAYQKEIREGRKRQKESIELDPEKPMQDPLSCGYFFRTLVLKPGGSVFIPVRAEGKDWNLEVKLHRVKTMTLSKIGTFQALETEPLMAFQGIFFRKGKIRGWISLDKRRIPLKMTVRIPVLGPVTAELKEYVAGKE